jgi:hypothetical protein
MRQELFRPCSSLGDTRKYSERFIGITKAWGRPQRIEVLAAEVSPHPPFDARVEGTDGERATRGAIGACSVGHRGESWRTRSSATMKDATHVMA